MKIRKRPTTIVAFIILLLISLGLILNLVAEKYVESRIKDVEFSSFSFSSSEKIKLNLLSRSITVSQAKLDGKGVNELRINQFRLKGIHYFPLLIKGDVVVNKILIEQPEIIISSRDKDASSGKIKNVVRIKKLEIKNGRFTQVRTDSTKNDTTAYLELDADIWNLNLQSKAQQIVFKKHSVDRIRLTLNDFVYFLPNGLYHAGGDTLRFDSQTQELTAVNARLKSNYSKYELGHVTGVETDWFDISTERIVFQQLPLEPLLQDSLLIIENIEFNKLVLHAFRDKRLPFPQKPDTKLPMQMLKDLPFKIHLDNVSVNNSYIDYTEHRAGSDEAGTVKFHRVNATISDFSNIDSLISGRTTMNASLSPMNESALEAEFVFPNRQFSHEYQVTGTLQPLPITAFNPMTEPVASVRIESGQTKKVAFNFYYNNERANGDMIFEYENLKVTLLDKENNSQKKIKSFFANTLVIRKDNLQSENSFSKGSISFARDKKKSVFNYWWKSLFSGIKDSTTR